MSYKASFLSIQMPPHPYAVPVRHPPLPPTLQPTTPPDMEPPRTVDPTFLMRESLGFDLNVKLGFVLSAMPREGKRTWGDKPVTTETIRKTEALMLEGRPSTGAYLSLYRAFCKWRATRGLGSYSPGRTTAVFGTYLCDAELKYSTVGTYLRMILVFLRRESWAGPCEWYIAEDLLRGIDLRGAAEEPDHALDIDEERAAHIIASIRAADVAFLLWAMCIVGGRNCDLLRLRRDQLTIRGTRVAVDFRVTKTSREHSERYSYTLSYGEPGETRHHLDVDGWIPFREEWRPFLEQEHPFTADVNRVLRVMHKAGFDETTYSFRRLFINRIIDRFTEEGVTAWCRVVQITGHQQSKNLEASYKTSAAKRLREAQS